MLNVLLTWSKGKQIELGEKGVGYLGACPVNERLVGGHAQVTANAKGNQMIWVGRAENAFHQSNQHRHKRILPISLNLSNAASEN